MHGSFSHSVPFHTERPIKKRFVEKPAGDKICRHQSHCTRKKCKFVHLEDGQLVGKKRPYQLCRDWPGCEKEGCRFVHYPPREDAGEK